MTVAYLIDKTWASREEFMKEVVEHNLVYGRAVVKQKLDKKLDCLVFELKSPLFVPPEEQKND